MLEEIYRLFADIRDISGEQLLLARCIVSEPERGDEMLTLLERRQGIMDKIDMLSAENPAARDIIINSSKHEDIMQITKLIQENDRQSRKLIEAVHQQVGNKLSNARNSMKAYDAYLPSDVCSEGWFFDRKN